MDNLKKELEWKNHAPFFVNLNDDLKELKIKSQSRDLKTIRFYFNNLEDLKVHYAPYINSERLNKKIDDCRAVVYSMELDRGKWDSEFLTKLIETSQKLREIHSDLMQAFYDNNLIPRFELVDRSGPAAARQKR